MKITGKTRSAIKIASVGSSMTSSVGPPVVGLSCESTILDGSTAALICRFQGDALAEDSERYANRIFFLLAAIGILWA
jgi:hypothetical protein